MTVIRVGVSPWPHLNPNCYPTGSKFNCSAGIELDVLQTITKMANLEVVFVMSNTSGCGDGANGKWSGLLKMLKDNEIDMIGNVCTLNKLTPYNQEVYSVSWPVWQFREQYVIQAPPTDQYTFAPFLPFSTSVWIAYLITCFIYLNFILIYSYVRYGDTKKFAYRLLEASTKMTDVCCSFLKHIPLQIIWPLWLFLFTTLFIFYNTYILSAILHRFPALKPFANCDQLAQELYSEKYRLLTYKNPPPIAGGCYGQPSAVVFNESIQNNKSLLLLNGTGYDLLSAIVEQNQKSKTKLVLVNGEPYIKLYLSEYLNKRDRLWIIDEIDTSPESRAVYVWRKNFTYAQQLDKNLIQISDFIANTFNRYIRLHGAVPHVGDQILEKSQTQKIKLEQLKYLFYIYFGMTGLSIFIFLGEFFLKNVGLCYY